VKQSTRLGIICTFLETLEGILCPISPVNYISSCHKPETLTAFFFRLQNISTKNCHHIIYSAGCVHADLEAINLSRASSKCPWSSMLFADNIRPSVSPSKRADVRISEMSVGKLTSLPRVDTTCDVWVFYLTITSVARSQQFCLLSPSSAIIIWFTRVIQKTDVLICSKYPSCEKDMANDLCVLSLCVPQTKPTILTASPTGEWWYKQFNFICGHHFVIWKTEGLATTAYVINEVTWQPWTWNLWFVYLSPPDFLLLTIRNSGTCGQFVVLSELFLGSAFWSLKLKH
jgi:hypothetical protein